MKSIDIYVIPDTQAKKNVKNPLIPLAYHIVELKPKKVIHLGDHWDMPSLSYYDKGKKSHRVTSYYSDIMIGNQFMHEFWIILEEGWRDHKEECEFIFLMGNHENRRNRALEYCEDKYTELLEEFNFDLEGWTTYPFLKILNINGVNFSHYFQNNNSDRPITSARQLLLKKHVSCIAGHQQGFDYAEQLTDKKVIQSIIGGSCYYHNETYKPQSNHHWRGSFLLKNVKNGMFEFNRYSLKDLEKKYI